MKSALLVLGAALLLSAPDSPVFAANAAVPPKPIRGEVIINRILLATDGFSGGLNLQGATCMINYARHWNPVWMKLN